MVFGKRAGEIDYGIRIQFENGREKTKFYGSDPSVRDKGHNEWIAKRNVVVVQDIQRAK